MYYLNGDAMWSQGIGPRHNPNITESLVVSELKPYLGVFFGIAQPKGVNFEINRFLGSV